MVWSKSASHSGRGECKAEHLTETLAPHAPTLVPHRTTATEQSCAWQCVLQRTVLKQSKLQSWAAE